jgi:prepilin-type N-terminal cleavage/methylation domain-containing protein
MKKGFTLVELLGTIVVLGIMLTIAIPSIIQTMRRANINEANAYLVRLYNASETYVELNKQSFEQLKTIGGRLDIPIKYLIDEGLIRELGQDPTSGAMITENWTVVATTQADYTISYALYNQNTNIESYVQDGLVLHFDAINNFGIGHSNTTTVWNDLSNQNNTGILTNFNSTASSGWTNRGLKFDGTDDIVITSEGGTNFSTFVSGVPFTYSAYYTTNTIGVWMGVLSNVGAWGAGGFNLQYGNNNRTGLGGVVYISNAVVPTASTTYHVLGVYNGTVMSLYINGVYVTQATVSYSAGSSRLTLGAFYNLPSLFMNGTIHSVMFYNRALTLPEIQTNYELDQVRYR